MSFWHFVRCMNVENTREWWYDKHTLDMLTYLDNKLAPNEKIHFGVHWMFHPTTLYYQETKGFDFFKGLSYNKQILPNAGYDYYYVFESNYNRFLTEGYEIEKSFSGFAYLLRKKDDKDY